MEKNLDNLLNLSNFPSEIQQHIASYLDSSGLSFFAQSGKRILKTILPLLHHYQTMFPLRLTTKGISTYLTQANQLFVCGSNKYGQLGLEDEDNRTIFTAVPWPKDRGRIQQLIAGDRHTVVLTRDNQLWVCGYNEWGQLGLGDNELRATFTAVPWPEERGRIQQVIAGSYHTVVLTENNRLWVCGINDYGQLGLDDQVNRASFTAVPWPEERGRIQQVIAGSYYTVVLTQDNRLWGCGSNDYGQLGLGDDEHRVTFTAVPWPADQGKIQQVIAGDYHTVLLTEANRLWGCGANGTGQLGLGDQANRFNFTAVPWPKKRGRIEQVSAGGLHSIVFTEDKQFWGCGWDSSGQLGLEDEMDRFAFTLVPWSENRGQIEQVVASKYHTVLLTDNNQLWMCGLNASGQLGLGDTENRAAFTPVKGLSTAMQQVFMLNHTFHQLIKFGKLLTLTSVTEPNTFYSQCQPNESDDQPPIKKMRL